MKHVRLLYAGGRSIEAIIHPPLMVAYLCKEAVSHPCLAALPGLPRLAGLTIDSTAEKQTIYCSVSWMASPPARQPGPRTAIRRRDGGQRYTTLVHW
jgi:hypothetical protein